MRWSPGEIETLKALYPSTPNRQIARRLQRSQYSVEMKAKNLKLTKQPSPPPAPTPAIQPFNLIDRDEVTKRDKTELLRYSWTLIETYKKELENQKLSDSQRNKILNGMGNMINIVNSIMRYTPEEIFMEQPNLYQQFLNIITSDKKVHPRRYVDKSMVDRI